MCFSGTIIGTVNATDRDLAKTPHTLIKYTLLNATDMFSIDGFTGVLSAKSNTLDREVQNLIFFKISRQILCVKCLVVNFMIGCL